MAAIKLCELVANVVCQQLLRVDVLIWDTRDSRHNTRGRDDTANLARMYYHLISNVVKSRWHSGAKWHIRVDKRSDIDWETLRDSLHGKTRREKVGLQIGLTALESVQTRYPIFIEQESSTHQSMIQVADLFAGLAAFSWNECERHFQWSLAEEPMRSGQLTLLPVNELDEISKRSQYKHEILSHLEGLELPSVVIRYKGKEGLRTLSPREQVNFWLYEPRRPDDKAPVRWQR